MINTKKQVLNGRLIYIYIYIYIEREGERERETEGPLVGHTPIDTADLH